MVDRIGLLFAVSLCKRMDALQADLKDGQRIP